MPSIYGRVVWSFGIFPAAFIHGLSANIASPMQQGSQIQPPDIRVEASRTSVQKGGVFEIRMTISARTPVNDVTICPVMPHGFAAEPVASAHDGIGDSAGFVTIRHMASGSSLTFYYRVHAPPTLGLPKESKDSGPVSNEEKKIFPFNVFYRVGADSLDQSATVSVDVSYTTNLAFYLTAGLVGALIGNLIKTGGRRNHQLQMDLSENRGRHAAVAVLKTMSNPSGLFTSLLVAVAVLLFLAKGGVPVDGWRQAAALGIGLGVLADDQLLKKLN